MRAAYSHLKPVLYSTPLAIKILSRMKNLQKGSGGMSKYCHECGKENEDIAKFCNGCGGKFEQIGTKIIDIPEVLDNRYEIIGIVKSGAMGCVYRAKDTRLDNDVAVKQMLSTFANPKDAQYAEIRFQEEAKILSTLHHSGIPKVIDYFTTIEPSTRKTLHYLVMTFIEGKDLETIIRERGRKPFSIDEVLNYFGQILEIFEYLHTQSPPIVYRDLNPRNIMVQDGKLFLVDFGIAKVLTPQQKGTAIGTPGYTAPEQYKGYAEPISDIFSLGALVHYLLTGINPEDYRVKIFSYEPPKQFNPSIPEELNTLIMSMVEILPDKRPQSAAIVMRQLTLLSQIKSNYNAQQNISAGNIQVLSANSYQPITHAKPAVFEMSIYRPVDLEYIGKNDKGFDEYRNLNDEAVMVLVPSGEFLMGCSSEIFGLLRDGTSDEYPRHTVYLDAYYIYKYEVTNKQFAKFVNEVGYKIEGNWKDYAISKRENHPVVNVTWNDAMAYCRWVGGTLPAEAQWEKAARGTDGKIYPWGNRWDGSKCNWYKGPKLSGMADIHKRRGTLPVGSFPSGASPYGCMDMAGNVWEWCGDWYGVDYYKNGPSRNLQGPESGQYRVLRGGSWLNDNHSAFRCSLRLWDHPHTGRGHCGFRVSVRIA